MAGWHDLKDDLAAYPNPSYDRMRDEGNFIALARRVMDLWQPCPDCEGKTDPTIHVCGVIPSETAWAVLDGASKPADVLAELAYYLFGRDDG